MEGSNKRIIFVFIVFDNAMYPLEQFAIDNSVDCHETNSLKRSYT